MKKIVLQECKTHGLTDFVLRNDTLKYRCKKCRAEYVKRRRKELKRMAVEYMGGKCCKCNYNRCIEALEFHHLDPKEKDFGISRKGCTRSWDKIKKELDKCILVCANCHREIENGLL